MSAQTAFKLLLEAKEAGVNHIFIEGGEPFLLPKLLPLVIKKATELGFWVGLLTNGFWAVSAKQAKKVLLPLVKAGLNSLSISTDSYHQAFVPLKNALLAAKTAKALGLEADLMVCQDKATPTSLSAALKTNNYSQVPVYEGGLVCRGRAVLSQLCTSGSLPWTELTTCRERLAAPGRVHIGPKGEVHLCQGLLLGTSALTTSLKDIFQSYQPNQHPLVAALTAGGPTALARLAQNYGFQPAATYADNCHLCFDARRFLLPYFPQYLGPSHLYHDKNAA